MLNPRITSCGLSVIEKPGHRRLRYDLESLLGAWFERGTMLLGDGNEAARVHHSCCRRGDTFSRLPTNLHLK